MNNIIVIQSRRDYNLIYASVLIDILNALLNEPYDDSDKIIDELESSSELGEFEGVNREDDWIDVFEI